MFFLIYYSCSLQSSILLHSFDISNSQFSICRYVYGKTPMQHLRTANSVSSHAGLVSSTRVGLVSFIFNAYSCTWRAVDGAQEGSSLFLTF